MLSERKLRLKFTSVDYLVEALVENHPNFIEDLTERLMLDELLCGECDSKDFLIKSMKESANKQVVELAERRLQILKEDLESNLLNS